MICDLSDVKKTLHFTRDNYEDKRVIDLPKDHEGTEFTIKDCLENAISTLEQLKEGMTEEQFIKEIFQIAFGETKLTQELLDEKDYQTVVDKIMEFSDKALKWKESEQ